MHPGAVSEQAAAPFITIEEWRGSSGAKLSRTAVLTASASSLAFTRFGTRWGQLWSVVLGAFIPEGFPSSVTPDYVPFQMWDTLQGLSTYIRSMLSTQALLSAIGVGETSATVIGATFQWFLRDFTGMLGGILFTFYQGSNLDSNAKMWRLVADFMNDLGMLMDLLSPLFPSALIPIVCLGSLSRSFTGVASGATRAALTQHFALAKNAADISAKEGSQETLATMSGMAIGMILANLTRDHNLTIWFSFLSLTIFHLYANYKAVKCLSLTTLNCERSSILLQHFLKNHEVMTPKDVSKEEHIIPFWASWRKLTNTKLLYEHIKLGAKASSLKHSDLLELSKSAKSQYKNDKYLLLEKKGEIQILIHKHANSSDLLKAFCHSLVLLNLINENKSLEWMDDQYSIFLTKLESKGWSTERLLSPSIVWRAHWVYTPDEKLD
ncbi:hypothetical protein LUZ60_005841 [Juncus effusus]|nr:hypothetical protein LUZ60_005841 [Juncus effusus]